MGSLVGLRLFLFPLAVADANTMVSLAARRDLHRSPGFAHAGRAAGEIAGVAPDAVDLVALENGGNALCCSDAFFAPMHQLLLPGRAENTS